VPRGVDADSVIDLARSRIEVEATVETLMVMPRSRSMSSGIEHLRLHLTRLRPPQNWMKRSASVDLP